MPEFAFGFNEFKVLFSQDRASEFMQSNPSVKIAELENRRAESGIRLAKTDRFPELLVGYLSESINGEKLAGLEVGISIPVWGKSNSIKQAKINKEMHVKRLSLQQQIIRTEWNQNKERSVQAIESKISLENGLSKIKTKELLKLSYELGEISLQEYLLELPFFYNIEDRILEAENQYTQSLFQQNKYWLSQFIFE